MLRVAVIAYLSLTTVVGPALCCCNARQLFSVVETSGNHCCRKPAREVAVPSHSHSHNHHHGHEHVAHHHSKPPAPVEHSQPTPGEQDKPDCPCGNRQATLVSTAAGEGTNVQALELQSQYFNHLAVDLPVLPEFDLKEASATAHIRPADLYGREMLRAYQTLRC